jgi:hypothetical protein
MPATGEWCAPTAELSAAQLGRLVDKTRRDTAIIRALKPTDDAPPPAPAWSAAAQRRPRQVMRKISDAVVALARPVVYPTAPSSRPAWLLPAFAFVVAAMVVAYLYS